MSKNIRKEDENNEDYDEESDGNNEHKNRTVEDNETGPENKSEITGIIRVLCHYTKRKHAKREE